MAEDSSDQLKLPPPEVLREIAAKQDARAREIRERRLAQRTSIAASESDRRDDQAAAVIQRNYRGYRARRALHGYGLDASTRWTEAIKDARYNRMTSPTPRESESLKPDQTLSPGRSRWQRARAIANHAGGDDTSDSEPDLTHRDSAHAKTPDRRKEEKRRRDQNARTMGLDYFLEMVDQKHRYGSNLRRYHVEWKKADTHENFFYWLDQGEGKDLDLEDRPRKRLDTEQVRYLSREERQRYAVIIDEQGRFCWAKNGAPITTSPDFKDSINGIVPADDSTPTWREVTTGKAPEPSPPSSDSESISGISTGSHENLNKYTNDELHDAKGLQKLNHLSVDSLMNHLLRKTTKKNTWIFVADTSFRLYIGIKQSGAFQHSSFLKGARISAAGLIKIKRGQLRKLSPLSGHYSPPMRNFREFVKTLKEKRADLSNCNISRSYAVILGLEGYISVKKKIQDAERGVKDVLNPEEKRRREDAERDKSKSAEKERQILLREREKARREDSFSARFKRSMGVSDCTSETPPSLRQSQTSPASTAGR